VPPPFTRLGPNDKSDIDSDAIKHLEAEEENTDFTEMPNQSQVTPTKLTSEVSTKMLRIH
jgi:hypothetical protein